MKYYRGKENIFLMTLTLIGAIVWIIIGRPQSINDIYMGIGINARPIYYMQFLGEYIVYAWACMGFMQTYLKRGGIYKVIREKSKKKYICQMEFRLALYLIYLIVIRFIIYSTCFVIDRYNNLFYYILCIMFYSSYFGNMGWTENRFSQHMDI